MTVVLSASSFSITSMRMSFCSGSKLQTAHNRCIFTQFYVTTGVYNTIVGPQLNNINIDTLDKRRHQCVSMSYISLL